ncbi:sugar transferase [Pseudomonadota bacterium]|nr:sugar transferase [Pseudomonadota bacterium]
MIRFFDIAFSMLAIIFLSPVLIICSIILFLTGENEIFYLQERIGRNGKRFNLIKFVTMMKDSPNIGTGTLTVKNDPRILPIGHFLRKTKINELTQLINILKGDMSVIGPRPMTEQTFSLYPKHFHKDILSVKPGLSGVGSIIFRNEENILNKDSNPLDFYENTIAPYKGSVEEWFAKNKSLYLYFLLIFLTINAVLFPKSNLHWRILKNLPQSPSNLKDLLDT